MNEKIKQLAEQAEKYANEQAHRAWHHSSGFNPFKEKFAELIVRECADVVSNQYSADWGKWSNTMILEHFGVEE
jgi:hypothetical protein